MLPFVIFYGLQDVLHEKVLIFPFNLLCFESRRTNKKQQYEVLLFAMQPWSLHSNYIFTTRYYKNRTFQK